MRTTLAIVVTGAIALMASGCGTTGRHTNELRPPAPILMSATITPLRVTVSPAKIGAGPIQFIITNLTGSSQTVTFESSNLGGGAPIRQQTAPINPSDTANLKANVPPGAYRVKVAGEEVAPAIVVIGPKRISSQNDLMLP